MSTKIRERVLTDDGRWVYPEGNPDVYQGEGEAFWRGECNELKKKLRYIKDSYEERIVKELKEYRNTIEKMKREKLTTKTAVNSAERATKLAEGRLEKAVEKVKQLVSENEKLNGKVDQLKKELKELDA